MIYPIIVTMGVCGTGKSSVGARLAQALNVDFAEGDDFHPPENVRLMQAGTPLTDADRQGWLLSLHERIVAAKTAGRGLVLSCSALKRSYRDILRGSDHDVVFVHLHGERALIEARMRARQNHYMPVALLDSQLAALEPLAADEAGLTLEITAPPDELLAQILGRVPALKDLQREGTQ